MKLSTNVGMWGKVGQNVVTTIFLLFSNFVHRLADPCMVPKMVIRNLL